MAPWNEHLRTFPPPDPREPFEPKFLGFPFTTNQEKRKPYRGSDPEWKEFIKFSKDKALARKIKGSWEPYGGRIWY